MAPRFDDFHRALERGDQATIEVALIDFFGFADNLDVRLSAHEAGMASVYYPAADAILLPQERETLERACPGP